MTPEEYEDKKKNVLEVSNKILEVGYNLVSLKTELERLVDYDFAELAMKDIDLIAMNSSLEKFSRDLGL